MITKRTLVIICLILSIIHHFIFHFGSYVPYLGGSMLSANALLALASTFIMVFLYFATKWRVDLKSGLILSIFDIMILWIFFNIIRSILTIHGILEWKDFLLNPYIGLSLMPTLFFLVGINLKYFSQINKILFFYFVLAWGLSLFFISHEELQIFLLMPIFYIIVTFPLQTKRNRILTLIISVTVIITSWTNRAGIMRILISYLIVVGYYIVLKININKKVVNIIIFCILMSPLYLLYQGVNGKNIFEITLGQNTGEYSQKNLRADTRTFLYFEVFQDLRANKAIIFGKGMNAGYGSDSFQTFNRTVVEVGFLQILLKTGLVGFLLYMTLIFSAIFTALRKSRNVFMKFLALLLASYVIMFFIENVLAYNLLNIIIWLIVGMCHSEELLDLNDQEIKDLFLNTRTVKVS